MSSSELRGRLDEAAKALRAHDPRPVDIGIVLGSGLSPFASTLAGAISVPYRDIPNMPTVSVAGHSGTLVLADVPGVVAPTKAARVAALAGRVHLYEGYPILDVVFGVRLLVTMGARVIVLTNAAGGIASALVPGDLVLITDHLNLQGFNPLVGPNDNTLGARFPDMSAVYDPALRSLARSAAQRAGVKLGDGVYAALLGPTYETPAEIRMLRTLGADLVGMSTVPEALAARHMGARVLGISCVTNLAAGVSGSPLSHREVEETATATRERFTAVISNTLRAIAETLGAP